MIAAYIGLGSNLQQPARQLRCAVTAVARLPDSRLQQVSSAYRSTAIGPGEQPAYLNAVLRLDTRLPALDLLHGLQEIERAQGRIRTIRWGARSLDLDLLLYGNQQIDTPHLSVPHPRLHERAFVLYPLAQIAGPKLLLPNGTELGTLLARCPAGDLLDTGLQLDDRASARQGTDAMGTAPDAG